MVVVSDTSALINLCRVSAEGLLLELFREVWIPPRVADEFTHLAATRPRFQGLTIPDWVRHSAAIQISAEVQACPDLNSGEAEALSLALAMEADSVLIDEAAGRLAALRLGIPFIGIAGILLRAKDHDLIAAVQPWLGRLRIEAGFFLKPQFEAEVLRLAGEAP